MREICMSGATRGEGSASGDGSVPPLLYRLSACGHAQAGLGGLRISDWASGPTHAAGVGDAGGLGARGSSGRMRIKNRKA